MIPQCNRILKYNNMLVVWHTENENWEECSTVKKEMNLFLDLDKCCESSRNVK
jgi:hypothetical protein